MSFTSFISIRSSAQDPSKWAVTSHTYDSMSSESKVEVVALSKFALKNEAIREAYKESEKRGRVFVLPNTGVLAIKEGVHFSEKTYQVVGLLQDGDVFPFSEEFTTSNANQGLHCPTLSQSGLLQSLDRADLLATKLNKPFIPPMYIEEGSKQTATPWKQGLNVLRKLSNMPSGRRESLQAASTLAMNMTSLLPKDLQDNINKNVANAARDIYQQSSDKNQRK